MRLILFILSVLISTLLEAQTTEILDTIYANDSKNVALFFPEPIRQGITGSENFVFTYNREKEQYFGLLQAKQGKESNLLVINRNGSIFSYIVSYKTQLSKLNYFIPISGSIGNEKPLEIKLKDTVQLTKRQENRVVYFQKFSEYLLNSRSAHIKTKRKNGLKLCLQKMVYNASEVYLLIEIENKSGIDFEVDDLNVYRTNGNKKRKASYQKLRQDVIYRCKMPSMIKDQQSKRFVYVFPKFVLGDNEKLEIELTELKGSRKIAL